MGGVAAQGLIMAGSDIRRKFEPGFVVYVIHLITNARTSLEPE